MEKNSNTGVLIACCGLNFCMIAGNKRGKSEESEYIHKINDDVLYAWSGLSLNEDALEPIKGYANDRLTLLRATELTEDYVYNHLATMMVAPRSYILAGRDEDGLFYIITVGVNKEERRVERKVLCPTDNKHIATLIVLPKSFDDPDTLKYYNKEVVQSATESETLPDLFLECVKIVRSVADSDEEINGDGICLSWITSRFV